MHGQAEVCDVLVIGSGAAGLATAVTASTLGLDVLVVDHADRIGGTSAVSGGEVWVPMNRQTGGRVADSNAAALTYLQHVTGDRMDPIRVDAYISRAAEALAFLEDHSHVKYEGLPGVVDYYTNLPGAACGLRSLGAVPFDGRLLGERFADVRPPLSTSMIFGGMSLGREDVPHFSDFLRSPRSAVHVARMLLCHARDRLAGHPRGTRMVMGNALVGRLLLTLVDRGVPIWLEAKALSLTREGPVVTGATVRRDGAEISVRARRAVVVASGGFSGNPSMQERFFAHVQRGQVHRTHLPESNDGSGLWLVVGAGGVLDRNALQPAAWAPVSIVPMPRGTQALMPHFGDRAKPGIIAVDQSGRRFANEASTYHDFVQAMLRTHADLPGAHCFVVTSHRHLRKYGMGRVAPFPGRIGPYLRGGYLVTAPTLRALAGRLGIEADALEESVRRFDANARRGDDPDFNKGETAYERAAGDPGCQPNPCVAPLGTGPYYAIRVVPGDIGTMLGVSVDARARALDAEGRPIRGLYAVGTVATSIMAGTYPAAGAMLGPALTFGYVAGRDIAGADAGDVPLAEVIAI